MTDEQRLDAILKISETISVSPIVAFGSEDYFLEVILGLALAVVRLETQVARLVALEGKKANVNTQ